MEFYTIKDILWFNLLFERELALLVALQGESSWKGAWGDIKLRC